MDHPGGIKSHDQTLHLQTILPPSPPTFIGRLPRRKPSRERANPLAFHAPRRGEEPPEKSWHNSAAVTEAMGNKSSAPSKGAHAGSAREHEAARGQI